MFSYAVMAASLFTAVASATSATAGENHIDGIEHAQLLGTLALKGKLHHVQGVDLDSRHIWVTSVDSHAHRGYLQQFDRASGQLLQRLELTDGPRYHPGGLSVVNHSIWVAVSEYRAKSSAVLEEIDIDSLQIHRKIAVADHLGCVAASDRRLVAGNWDSKRIYIIDLTNEQPMQIVRNPTPTHYQDMKLVDGQLVAGGTVNRHGGTIDWIEYPSMKVVRTLHSGPAGRHIPISPAALYTGEGMALQGRELYLLPESRHSRLFHFRLDAPGN